MKNFKELIDALTDEEIDNPVDKINGKVIDINILILMVLLTFSMVILMVLFMFSVIILIIVLLVISMVILMLNLLILR